MAKRIVLYYKQDVVVVCYCRSSLYDCERLKGLPFCEKKEKGSSLRDCIRLKSPCGEMAECKTCDAANVGCIRLKLWASDVFDTFWHNVVHAVT